MTAIVLGVHFSLNLWNDDPTHARQGQHPEQTVSSNAAPNRDPQLSERRISRDCIHCRTLSVAPASTCRRSEVGALSDHHRILGAMLSKDSKTDETLEDSKTLGMPTKDRQLRPLLFKSQLLDLPDQA